MLLGHSKKWAYEMLLETDFPDSPAGRPFLDAYFPTLLRERYAEHFQEHPLRREIIATVAINHVVNQAASRSCPGSSRAPSTGSARWWGPGSRSTGKRRRRRCATSCSPAGRPAAEEQAALVEIEDALETAARDRLDGKKKASGAKALRVIADRLGL